MVAEARCDDDLAKGGDVDSVDHHGRDIPSRIRLLR
jgi:hypothetical protein